MGSRSKNFPYILVWWHPWSPAISTKEQKYARIEGVRKRLDTLHAGFVYKIIYENECIERGCIVKEGPCFSWKR